MKIEPRPARAPKWSLSNKNLIENQWKSSPGQPGPQNGRFLIRIETRLQVWHNIACLRHAITACHWLYPTTLFVTACLIISIPDCLSLHLSSCQHPLIWKGHSKTNSCPDRNLVTIIHLEPVIHLGRSFQSDVSQNGWVPEWPALATSRRLPNKIQRTKQQTAFQGHERASNAA